MEAEDGRSAQRVCSRQHAYSSLDWQKLLSLMRISSLEALRLKNLFFFEVEKDSEHFPSLILGAAIKEPSSGTRLPLNDAELAILDQPTRDTFVIEVSSFSEELANLKSFAVSEGCKMLVIAPVRYVGKTQGYLLGCSDQLRNFTPVDLSIFSLSASYIAAQLEIFRLRAETAFRSSEAMSLRAISSALIEGRGLEVILTIAIDGALQLLDASDALVLLLEEKGNYFRVYARKGDNVSGIKTGGKLSVKNSLNGLVARTGQPLVSSDAINDPRADRPRARYLNVRTAAIAPLKIRHTTIGTMAVHNKRDGYFSQADLGILCAFANQVAIAIDNERLFSGLLRAKNDLQRKAQELQEILVRTMGVQEGERRRIAADVHDQVVSRIIGALYEVETCIQMYRNSEDLNGQLLLVRQLLNEAVEKTRSSIYDLWPVTLDHMGLVPALQELLSHQERLTGVKHLLVVKGAPYAIRPSVKITVYRIIQEALSNVYQHARATSVKVVVEFTPNVLRSVVQDDGIGFDTQRTARPPSDHFGLISMRERALGIGGSLRVNSVLGKGSRVILEVPASKCNMS